MVNISSPLANSYSRGVSGVSFRGCCCSSIAGSIGSSNDSCCSLTNIKKHDYTLNVFLYIPCFEVVMVVVLVLSMEEVAMVVV